MALKFFIFKKSDTSNHVETLTYILSRARQFHCVNNSPVIELLHLCALLLLL